MIDFFNNLFNRKNITVENILRYPEGKRYYRESHTIRKNSIDEDALKIVHRLNKFGYKSYLVGGCVRDLLLGRKPKDFDVVTSATPNQIRGVFNNCRIIGKRFKIVHILFKGKIIEVSTFRSLPEHRLKKASSDKDYLLKRDNSYGTAKEDAARRDFTINALYFDPRNESIIDYVGGVEDIQNKILRPIGDPEISFKEDPVRMLRAIKFSILHGLEMDKKIKTSIKKNRFEIEKASQSRMLEEYNKIFRTWKTSLIFQGFAENHLLDVIFSEALDSIKKDSNWSENFLSTSIGKRLVIADRMLSEREELTPVIFFALIFTDIVSNSIKKDSKNIVQSIKTGLEPICSRLGIAKRDKDRLLKIFASQNRFLKTDDKMAAQNEFFRKKDFFYEAFMIFKINAITENDETSIQAAFFWEISTRTRPPRSAIHQPKTHHSGGQKSGKGNRFHKGNPNSNKRKFEHEKHNTPAPPSEQDENSTIHESIEVEAGAEVESSKQGKISPHPKRHRHFRRNSKFHKEKRNQDTQSRNEENTGEAS
ncbi:MAG: CCA tRNA nucleotidyltransferase [Leptospiraceae bacterium]|nr:polynucleotide adenylyltransferase PcnB [Leptospiraceae bacterium]MCK6382458.1 CCA tRNA nucleotidyltransferase [Leptospiraceae bacterium]NUM40923.1 polynucleotide adenylyltransferase PcnB [Leptospiraceae bacterium]